MAKENTQKICLERTVINNIKRPILLPAAFLILLLLLFFFYTLYSQEMKNSETNMLRIIASVEQSFLRKVDEKAFYLASQSYIFNNNLCISAALLNQNKQQLQNCTTIIVEQLQDSFELYSLNYIDVQENYILKLSANNSNTPNISNDDKKSPYFITSKAMNTQQNIYGLEISHGGQLQLIMTFPFMQNNQVIAYIEIITDIQHVFHSLEDDYNLSLFILLEKSILQEIGIKQSHIEQYDDFEGSLWDYFDHHLLIYGNENFLGKEIKNYFDEDTLLNNMVQANFINEGSFYTAGHFVLLNGSGLAIGHVGLISDNTMTMKSLYQLLINFIISYLILTGILFLLFYRYIFKLEGQLKSSFKSLEDEITERKQAEISLKKLSNAVEYSGSIVMITDKTGVLEYVNPSFSEVTGYSASEVVGKTPAILKANKSSRSSIKSLWNTILSGKRWVNNMQNRRKNGELYWSRLSISPVFDDQHQITHFVGVSEDISELKKAHDSLRHMAFYDVLTELPNRRLFLDRLKQTLERNFRNKTSVAILFLDLDNFKEINDSLGHDAGDMLLKIVSDKLQTALRKSDTVARQGGDEFIMLLDNLSGDPLDVKKEVEKLVQKILLKVAEPMVLSGTETHITMSIGITFYPIDGDDVEQLLKNADLAMYQSKQRGRNTYTFYHSDFENN